MIGYFLGLGCTGGQLNHNANEEQRRLSEMVWNDGIKLSVGRKVCTAFSSFPKSCLVKCHEEYNKIKGRAKFL